VFPKFDYCSLYFLILLVTINDEYHPATAFNSNIHYLHFQLYECLGPHNFWLWSASSLVNDGFVFALHASSAKLGVLVELDHLLHDLIVAAVEVSIGCVVDLGFVAALLNDPLLFAFIQVTLEVCVIFANAALDRVVVAISYVVSALWNCLCALDIVREECLAFRA